MSMHTPGPWYAWQNSAGSWDINVEDDIYAQSICTAVDNEFIDDCDSQSNANLISAAPDLLEALESMIAKAYKQNWNDNYPEQIALAEAAIDKAKGES